MESPEGYSSEVCEQFFARPVVYFESHREQERSEVSDTREQSKLTETSVRTRAIVRWNFGNGAARKRADTKGGARIWLSLHYHPIEPSRSVRIDGLGLAT